ncbi:MAG: FKBP-type peptidyl-prolyl cis-trans isomerase [Treponema sp.]|nr:FKBP-type peptidyl-prolyl cis-trans isomerase [Treponema sp.]
MKNKIRLIFTIFIVLVYLGCNGSGGSSPGEVNISKDASYALGLIYGSNVKRGTEGESLFLNMDEFLKGIKDGVSGNKPRFDMETANQIFEDAYSAFKDGKNAAAIQEENTFLAENSQKPGIIVTESGLQYEVITEGRGPKPTEQDRVRIHYEARFTNGDLFESSYNQGEPEIFGISQVFPGWGEGMMLMSAGSKYKLYIPSALAFGEAGYIDPWSQEVYVRPYTVMIFEIELLEINPAGE